MTTRFYFPKAGSAPSSPTVSTGWTYSDAVFTRLPAKTTKDDAGYTVNSYNTCPVGPGAIGTSVHLQYVSDPLDVDQTISGTFSFVIDCFESIATADATVAVGIRVMQGDTSTERGVLRAPALTDTEVSASGYYTRIANAVAVSAVNALAGDRVVIELGYRYITPVAGSVARNLIGAISGGTDLALTSGVANATYPSSTNTPWLELSTTLTFIASPEATVAFTTDDAAVAAAAEISNAATVAFTTDDAVVEAAGNIEVSGAAAFTTDDAAVEAAGVVDGAAAVAFTTDDAVVAATGDSGLSTATVAFTTDDAAVAAAGEISNAAAVAFTTDDAVVAATGTTTTAPPTERFLVTVRDAVTGALLTGLTTVYISVNRDADSYQFDYTDNQYRAVAAVRKLAMDEVSAANSPGEYAKALQVLTWTGDITITIEYNDGTRINTWIASSVEYLAGVRIKTGSRATPADVPSAAENVAASAARLIDGAITGEIFDKTVLAFAAGKRRGLVPGAAIPALEEYLRQDGTTAQISLSPTDVAGNGTPVINQDP